MKSKLKFTQLLKQLIKENGVNLAEISLSTGLAKSTLHNLINGTEPSLSKAAVLAEYFGVSLDYFITGKKTNLDPLEGMIRKNVHRGVYEVTIKKVPAKEELQ